MKVKELKRTVNVSWSPAAHYPVMLATGSAAQQVDSSFSSNAYLEVYSLNLNDPGYDLEMVTSIQTKQKFQKLVWSSAGVLVGGCDGGLLTFYGVDRLLKGASDSLVASNTKHNGHISALDINPFQKNLLASGASDSEIFIWDLNNTSTPMSPGNKSQPFDHVQDVSWNQQVQHILASTFATRCVVWDLRKNEPIMKLSDAQSRTRWRAAAWHPSVATQLCIASEDDQVPVIQLWDLRLAASPLATLEGHTKGVMALSWSSQDPDLLLSASKDGRVLCWNPSDTTPGNQLLCEVSSEGQWVFDVSWCPRTPSLLVSSSFDGHVNIHCVNGGTKPNVWNKNSSIMESFPGMESLNQLAAQNESIIESKQLLPHPPAWDKRPVRAKFAFGGKLVSFDRNKEEGTPKLVYISQVVTEPYLAMRAAQLDSVLNVNDSAPALAEYCRQRGDKITDQNERYTWFFLKANFEPAFRSEVLNLLGFKQDEIVSKFKGVALNSTDSNFQAHCDSNVDSITSGIAGLSRGASLETEAELSPDTSTDLSEANAIFDRKLTNVDLSNTAKNVTIPISEDLQGMICRALICGNLEEAVELCLEAKRVADALIIASLGSQDLLTRVQQYYLSTTSQDPVSVLSRTLLLSQWSSLLKDTSSRSWRETLATVVTHCDNDALANNCELLGEKLIEDGDPSLVNAATICYLCSASVDVLVDLWQRKYSVHESTDFEALAQLVELAMLARKAAILRGRPIQTGGKLDALLTEYAMRLSSQGELQAALNSLQAAGQQELKHRLECALSIAQPYLYGVKQQKQQPTAYGNQYTSSNRSRTASGHQLHQTTTTRRSYDGLQNNDSNTYNTVAPPSQNQPWNQQTAATMPPRPPSAGSQAATVAGVTGRSKYVLDPSVKSNQPGYQNNYNYMSPTQNNSYAPIPQNLNSATVPSPAVLAPNLGPIGQPSVFNPIAPAPTLNPSQGVLNPNQAVPSVANTNIPNGGAYGQNQFSAMGTAQPGWNDPPPINAASKKIQPKQDHQAPSPITHPLFGVEPPQQIPLQGQQFGQMPGQYNPNDFAPPPTQYGPPPTQFGPPPTQFVPPPAQIGPTPTQFAAPQNQFGAQSNQYGLPQSQFAYGDPYGQPIGSQYGAQGQFGQTPMPPQVESPAPVLAQEPVIKPPIPEEHIHMQTVFDALRTQCSQVANNPQMKRKLEEVQRRLEHLYDFLRENKLSENALQSLHHSVQSIQQGNYELALNTLTALATGPDFASVASFLPGLKVLMQLAMQNGVYVN